MSTATSETPGATPGTTLGTKTPGVAHDRILGESDWDDQDLLTFEEADERLREEIQHAQAALEATRATSPEDPTIATLTHRITALTRSRNRLAAGPTPLAATTPH